MKLDKKVVVVTGAGSGIGKELTIALVNKGARVVAVDLRKEGLDQLENSMGEKKESIRTFVLDVSNKGSIDKLPEDIKENVGEVDCIINNAGIIQSFKKVNDLDFETIDKVMKVNFYGTVYMTKAFLPYLLKRPEAYIVNASSMGGFLPVPGQSVYGASKAAVKLFTEGLYAELLDTNVGVSIIFPGATATNITANSGVDAPKVDGGKNYKTLPASEAARLIIEGIESNKPQIFLGSDCKSMNFLYRLNPIKAVKMIAKQMQSLLK